MKIFAFVIVLLLCLVAVKATPVQDFCTDSDGGIDVWNGGIAINQHGSNADDCDGASQNLKEFYCDGTTLKHDNIKCSDFNAQCITVGDKSVPDYCACAQGYTFDGQTCTQDNNVPEFGIIAGAIAFIGALGIFIVRRF